MAVLHTNAFACRTTARSSCGTASKSKVHVSAHTIEQSNAVRNIVGAVSQGRVEVNDAVDNICEICSNLSKVPSRNASHVHILDATNVPVGELASTLEDLATRQHTGAARNVTADVYAAVRQQLKGVEYHAGARMLMFTPPEPWPKPQRLPGTCAVVAATPQDLPLAYEAVVATGLMSSYATIVQGVSTSDLSSLVRASDRLQSADVLIVCSQSDPALPGVIAGMVDAPVIALPGAAAAAPNPTMISATPGLLASVPGNGASAAYAAVRMLRIAAKFIQHRADREQSKSPVALFEGSEDSHDVQCQQYSNVVPTNGKLAQQPGKVRQPEPQPDSRQLVSK